MAIPVIQWAVCHMGNRYVHFLDGSRANVHKTKTDGAMVVRSHPQSNSGTGSAAAIMDISCRKYLRDMVLGIYGRKAVTIPSYRIASGRRYHCICFSSKWVLTFVLNGQMTSILNDHKICGILVEEKEGDILVGIGINLVSAPESNLLHKDRVLPAACLNTLGSTFSPLDLWIKIMSSGKDRLEKIVASMTPETFLENLETKPGLDWKGDMGPSGYP
jgi:hypothetical protein